MAYDVNAGKDLVSVDEILARYLWNQETAPSPSELVDDKWIRYASAEGDALMIDAQEYMTHGGGRFVSAADFEFFKDFFSSEFSAGSYDFISMWNILKPKKPLDPKISNDEKVKKFTRAISQYEIGIGSSDYLTRAFIFGSTSFTIDFDSIKFVVKADGTREIQGLKIIPCEDNFDFDSSNAVANNFNKGFKEKIDPFGIGRKVPIQFTGDVSAVTVTDKDFAQLQEAKTDRQMVDYRIVGETPGVMNSYLTQIKALIKESPSINYTDSHGRKVIYDGEDRFHDSSLKAESAGLLEIFSDDPDSVLIGGGGEDILKGGNGDDLLIGSSSCSIEKDMLMGGKGYDTYIADKMDLIEDSDGEGAIFNVDGSISVANKYILNGGFHYKNDPENTYYGHGNKYYWGGKDLIINDGLTVKNFKNGDLNIRLREKDDTRPDFKDAENIRSPIIIDMNGDGVKTTAQGKHTYFDHDGNGFAENTGWVDSNDALLVLDRNQNGLIDDGKELFGSNTLLSSGKKAQNGFEALAEFDENRDGVIDTADSVWSRLQLWQDKNQNGFVDEGELLSLSNTQITAIGLKYLKDDKKDENGHEHRETSQVTWADGHQTDATDVWFKVDKGDTFNTDNLAIDKDIAKLPYIQGFGNVSDLHTAMQKDAVLKEMVKAYLTADTKTRELLLNNLIYRWTGSEQIDPVSRGKYIDDARKLVTLENLTGSDFLGTWCWGEIDSDPHSKAAPILITEFNKFAEYVSASLLAEGVYKELFSPIILAQWNAEQQNIGYDYSKLNQELVKLVENNQLAEARKLMQIDRNLGKYNSEAKERRLNNIRKFTKEANNEMVSKLYGELDNIYFSTTGNDVFVGQKNQKDRYIFRIGHGQDVIEDRGYVRADENELHFEGAKSSDVLFLRDKKNLIIKAYGANDSVILSDYFSYWNIWDFFKFVFEDESVSAKDLESRYIITQNGDDKDNRIDGWHGKDLIKGGAGNDELYGKDGYDILIGGAGNDKLYGGNGHKDRYEFEAGHGADIVYDEGNRIINPKNQRNDLVFKGAKFSETRFICVNQYDLVIQAYGAEDSVTLPNFFNADYYASREFNFIFDDQSITYEDLYEYPLLGSDKDGVLNGGKGNDVLNGKKGNNILNGNDGNDILVGGAGKDILNGGDGDDILWGGFDYDVLNGGTGNDVLNGGDCHKDRYEFEAGHGKDIVNDLGYMDKQRLDERNDLIFKGANLADAKFIRSGEDLVIYAYGSDDSVTLPDYFNTIFNFINEYNRAFNFVFEDKSVTYEDIERNFPFTQNGDEKDNVISGWLGIDILNGGAGNDTLKGENGNDILNGGAGDDILWGGYGYDILNGGTGNDILKGGDWHKDRYEFEAGHGYDVIDDRGESSKEYIEHRNDVVFKGANFADAEFICSEGNLIIKAYGTEDSVTILNYFGTDSYYYHSFNYIFEDITITYEYIIDNYIFTFIGSDEDDRLYGSDGNDILNGGKGNDSISGGLGYDILIGGTGNDRLFGGDGHKDRYEFEAGHGNDFIDDMGSYGKINYYKDNNDLVFKGAKLTEAEFTRSGDHLVIRAYGGDDSVTLWGYFKGDSSSYNEYRSFNFIFEDETIISKDIKERYTFNQSGNEKDNTIFGWDGKDILKGGEGNDTLWGGEGDDILYGEENNDILNGGDGNDILYGGDGNDILYGEDGNDTLYGGDGNDILYGGTGRSILNGGDGDDILNGGRFTDILIGGAGNDILSGGDRNKDRYEFEAGHGHDIVNDLGGGYGKFDFNDLVFKGAQSAEAVFSRSENNLIIQAYGSEDSVTLPDYFDVNNQYSREFNFIFDDKTINEYNLYSYPIIQCIDDKNNTIYGWNGKDILKGGPGNDILNGGSGNDVLIGGAGNDILKGGDFDKDCYEFEAGHGQDMVNDLGNIGKKYQYQRNDLVFKGVNLTDAEFIRSANGKDLVIYAYGSADSVTLPDYFNTKNKNSRAFNFVFEDKSVTYEDMKKNPSFGVTKAKNGNDIVNLRKIASSDLADNSPLKGKFVSNHSNDPSAQIQNLLSAMAGFTPAIDDRLNSVEPIQQSMHLTSAPTY
ncbi:hypothetical protein ABX022_16580 [Snodgrassella alvi]|uniref:hypothetical protein n=1 Tax=Snodgrassella alvi TaxID=1196083 RepID=UPI00351C08F1